MPISTQAPAPYTAGVALILIIRRYRDKGLTIPFTVEVLVRAGVPESLGTRTLQALQTLDLIDDKGMPTPTLQKLRVVGEPEYKACLADWIKSAYAEIFRFVDPGKDEPHRVRDAFRPYEPVGQQGRMVALFYALCAEAGLVDESKKSEPKLSARKPQAPRVAPASGAAPARNNPKNNQPAFSGSLPPALSGLMQSIPQDGWTKEKRDRFIETFKSVLDFVVPIVKHEPTEGDQP